MVCISFVCSIVHMYLNVDLPFHLLESFIAFNTTWSFQKKQNIRRARVYCLRFPIAFGIYEFGTHMVTCVFLFQNHPKTRAHIPYTTYTHRIADRQFFMILYIHCHSVFMYVVCFFYIFFCRWIFLGYLVNLFVCLCMYDAASRVFVHIISSMVAKLRICF